MHLQFQGAARTVTGSMHVLTAGGSTVLLDCGIDSFSGNADRAEIPGAVLKEAGFSNVGIPAHGDEVSLA